jgi:hypothetical protein
MFLKFAAELSSLETSFQNSFVILLSNIRTVSPTSYPLLSSYL